MERTSRGQHYATGSVIYTVPRADGTTSEIAVPVEARRDGTAYRVAHCLAIRRAADKADGIVRLRLDDGRELPCDEGSSSVCGAMIFDDPRNTAVAT